MSGVALPELLLIPAILLLLWGAKWLSSVTDASSQERSAEESAEGRAYLDRLFGPP
jgi:hypothetical protein